jgi:hypothetical protein
MVPLAALLACSLYPDDALVAAIIDNVEQNPLSIIVPDDRSDPNAATAAPATVEQARARVRELIAGGASPLIGLMQVPPAWAQTFGREPEELLDACVNVSIGTAMLSEFDYACARRPKSGARAKPPTAISAEARRECALDRYSAAIGMVELTTVVGLTLRHVPERSTRASDAPIFPSTGERRVWGADCLLAFPSRIVAAITP